ncbi:MAG TPA: hypothetical protein VJR87_04425 [Allosphingosinicella sp.]|nr:hypothetical protein [Allosphingosinicella sp.]
MSILCRLAQHKAVPSQIWNDGYYFSRCRSCGCEMIGRGGIWQRVPRGFRVVWRERTGERIDWRPIAPASLEAGRLSDMVQVRH